MNQEKNVWNPYQDARSYRNPILYADYSDPDVIRVGEDYFMVASSFCNVPALPLLHSKDLVGWKVVNYILDKIPFEDYNVPAHGRGVWAPAIRYYQNKFWGFFSMPDEGIFCCTAENPFGKWSAPFTVRAGKGWIDPCPFWDEDGNAYLVNAFAKSRIGFKSILHLSSMKPDGSGLLDDGKHIFDGHNTQPTIEGPKLYKRNGYYYIFAPAGGVKYGWQTVLRSKNIWGPYEEKIVLFQGGSTVNGPHQGALVDTPSGEYWFLHFQDTGACGRIVHLQPVVWENDWPVIGDDSGHEGCGQPVTAYRMPNVGKEYPPVFPADSDDFDGDVLGLQWQWNANPQKNWHTLGDNALTLHSQPHFGKLCDIPNLLLQKFPAPDFQATAKISVSLLSEGDTAGMMVLGGEYGALAFRKTATGLKIVQYSGSIKGHEEKNCLSLIEISGWLYLRLLVRNGCECVFSLSMDNVHFTQMGRPFKTSAGIWVGAKLGLFCIGEKTGGDFPCGWIHIIPAES